MAALAQFGHCTPAKAFLATCTNDSTATSTISSWQCADYYDVVTTRYAGGPVTVAYMTHKPTTTPSALVVLLAGGKGQASLTGDTTTHKASGSSNNFLVRSATLFAAAGFLAVTIDAPSNTGTFTNAQYDSYRLSEAHAQDIIAILNAVQAHYGTNLDVFLAGTSRGSLSAVAQFYLGIGSFLSSAVTANGPNDDPAMLYLGKPGVERLAPGYMHNIPAEVLYNTNDQCSESPPAGSVTLGQQLAVNIPTTPDQVSGGMQTSSACEALSYHGFFGIENAAVSAITTAMSNALNATDEAFPNRERPLLTSPPALPQTMLTTSPGTKVCTDLASLVRSPADTSQLAFLLPYPKSSHGAQIRLHGSVVTYTPPASVSGTVRDGFVYLVFDRQHGDAAGIVSVAVSSSGAGGNCPP
jgi:pimeloyl-ACP methyl ester carboxylesterase